VRRQQTLRVGKEVEAPHLATPAKCGGGGGGGRAWTYQRSGEPSETKEPIRLRLGCSELGDGEKKQGKKLPGR